MGEVGRHGVRGSRHGAAAATARQPPRRGKRRLGGGGRRAAYRNGQVDPMHALVGRPCLQSTFLVPFRPQGSEQHARGPPALITCGEPRVSGRSRALMQAANSVVGSAGFMPSADTTSTTACSTAMTWSDSGCVLRPWRALSSATTPP
jgi:hypothetical protein